MTNWSGFIFQKQNQEITHLENSVYLHRLAESQQATLRKSLLSLGFCEEYEQTDTGDQDKSDCQCSLGVLQERIAGIEHDTEPVRL